VSRSACRDAFIISGKIDLLHVLFAHPLGPQVWAGGLLSVTLLIATKSPCTRQGHRPGGDTNSTTTGSVNSGEPGVVQ